MRRTHHVCCSRSGYQFEPHDLNRTDTAALFYHRLAESFKFAHAKRSQLGDPQKTNLQQVRFTLALPQDDLFRPSEAHCQSDIEIIRGWD